MSAIQRETPIVKILTIKALALFISILLFITISHIVFERFSGLPGYAIFKHSQNDVLILYAFWAFLVGMALPVRPDFSSMVIWAVYYMHILPWIVLGARYHEFGPQGGNFLKFLLALSVGTLFVLIGHITARYNFKVKVCLFRPNAVLYLGILANAAVILMLTLNFGATFDIPTYTEIYQRRSAYKVLLGSIPGGNILLRVLLIINYTFIPSVTAIASFLIAIRRYMFLAILVILSSIVSSLLLFSVAAFKSILALVILALSPFLLYKFRHVINLKSASFLWLLTVPGLVALALYFPDWDPNWLLHYFRRIFIVPGMNVWFYIKLFSLYSPEFQRDAPLIVSQVIYGTSGSANSGLIGSGVALGGIWGVLLNMFIFFAWLVVTGSYAKFVPREILLPLAVIYGYLFSNSATTTVLFSYGAIFAPLLLLTAACIKEKRRRRKLKSAMLKLG